MKKESKNKLDKIDFIGIGAAKCATTWVFRCLQEHPEICGPYIKEISFFLTEKNPLHTQADFENKRGLFSNGLASYLEYFSHCTKDSKKGEFSVSYMPDPGSAKLIHESFPDVKIIACLRDPVKRAISSYHFSRDFMQKEKHKTFEKSLEDPASYHLYIKNGMYYEQLKRYFEIFPKENIGIFLVDDLKADPLRFIQSIYRFIGVDDKFIPPSINKRSNSSSVVRINFLRRAIDSSVSFMYFISRKTGLKSLPDILRKIGLQKFVFFINQEINLKKKEKDEIDPLTKERLRRIFKEDIEQLEGLIGKDLSSWK